MVSNIELTERCASSSNSMLILNRSRRYTNDGVNAILPGWEHLCCPNEEEGLDMLIAAVNDDDSFLTKTGSFGETILHFALLMHRNEAAKWLIENHKYLRDKVYGFGNCADELANKNMKLYEGEGCLHIIIANRDFDMALTLLDSYHQEEEKTYNLCEFVRGNIPKDYSYPLNIQRATGDFFKGTGDNSVYYGETALDFAVSTNQIKMVDLLMGYPTPKVNGKRNFNGKWRASMKFRDSFHQNSVFHICALKGHTEMWQVLIDHMIKTIASISTLHEEESEIKLSVHRIISSQLNAYGLTPMQVAAYKNNTKMLQVILNTIRLQLWTWGEEAFYMYPLNEIDEYFKSPRETPGIPINNIILCEGNSELFDIALIVKLMKEKWDAFGKAFVVKNLFTQLCFCILLTWLFLDTYPHLGNLERDWGRVRNLKGRIVYVMVLLAMVWEMIRALVEMGTIFKINFALHREILTQKYMAESWREDTLASAETSEIRIFNVNEKVREELKFVGRKFWKSVLKSLSTMLSIYFEMDLAIPTEFHNRDSKKRAHGSVTGFFRMISLISDICFVVAQGAAMSDGILAARALLIAMIFIMICEYVLLFLWLQTNRKVSRFLVSIVNILGRDIVGFAAVFLIVQVVFSICFLLLAEKEDESHKMWRSFFIFYELTVGTGEFFKDALDEMAVDNDDVDNDDGNTMDSCRMALLLITYLLYISITLVILINLLIAVMTETTSSLTKQMKGWERNVKLSSVSMLSRRWLAGSSIARSLGIRCSWFIEKIQNYTIGGKTGTRIKILEGRIKIREWESLSLQETLSVYMTPEESEITLTDYYSNMRYWTVLEHEAMDICEDAKLTKQSNFIDDACKAMSANMKDFLKSYSVENVAKIR